MIQRVVQAASAVFLLSGAALADSVVDMLPKPDGSAEVAEARSLLSVGRVEQTREAYITLESAQELGSGEAYRVMGRMYEDEQEVEPVGFIARDLYEMGSWHDDPESMFKTGARLVREQRGAEGWPMIEAAANRGHVMAHLEIAKRDYSVGFVESAHEHLMVAVEAGIPEARHMLAEHYEKGSGGLSRSYSEAFVIYHDLAKMGDAKAMQSLGYYFVRGLIGKKDEVAAAHWYHEAAKAGNPDGMKAYAWMAANGVGTEKNGEEASFYKKMAHEPIEQFNIIKR